MSRKDAYVDFFRDFKRRYNEAFPDAQISADPSGINYIRIGSPVYPPRSGFHLGFTRDDLFRVEVTFNTDEDKAIFDTLIRSRQEIERNLGEKLDWNRLDGDIGRRHRLRSQVSVFYPGSVTIEDAEYTSGDLIDWAVPMAHRFMSIFDKYLDRLR